MPISWSEPIPFESRKVENVIPDSPGVYRISQPSDYPRYRGHSNVLKIGQSSTSLRQEIMNHFQRHIVANRLRRIILREGIEVSVTFVVTDSDLVSDLEKKLLRSFEDEHWDLPVLNSQRGYSRGEDKHYRG